MQLLNVKPRDTVQIVNHWAENVNMTTKESLRKTNAFLLFVFRKVVKNLYYLKRIQVLFNRLQQLSRLHSTVLIFPASVST
jgi:hypothetical protein